ncbi:uncharacterized protein PAC_12883 [Phialocephala subalpina]|uniref:Chitin-binding type-1 domain-containing protein n=1 Tax=Phialocephala subalpina TaxID=576137 RepID=A0A1L7XDB9_9HELO|nr:uncharacterized protein PAC_12883 [Phialocephala subalpina]
MFFLPAALFSVLLSVINAEPVDVSQCRSIYLTIWDDGSLPPETYVLSSETYSLARPPCPTSPKSDGGTTIQVQIPPAPSFLNARTPATAAPSPAAPTMPLNSLSAQAPPPPNSPPPTPYITMPYPLFNGTSVTQVRVVIPTVVVAPPIFSQEKSNIYIPFPFSTLAAQNPIISSQQAILDHSSFLSHEAFPVETSAAIETAAMLSSNGLSVVTNGATLYSLPMSTSQVTLLEETSAAILVEVLPSASPTDSEVSTSMMFQFPTTPLQITLPRSSTPGAKMDTSMAVVSQLSFVSAVDQLVATLSAPSAFAEAATSMMYRLPTDSLQSGWRSSSTPDNMVGTSIVIAPQISSAPVFSTEWMGTSTPLLEISSTPSLSRPGSSSFSTLTLQSSSAGAPSATFSFQPFTLPQSRTSSSPSITSIATLASTLATVSAQTSNPPARGMIPTQNGVCGNDITCLGWILGECCSSYDFCGSTADYCVAGCQPEYGICSNETSSSIALAAYTSVSGYLSELRVSSRLGSSAAVVIRGLVPSTTLTSPIPTDSVSGQLSLLPESTRLSTTSAENFAASIPLSTSAPGSTDENPLSTQVLQSAASSNFLEASSVQSSADSLPSPSTSSVPPPVFPDCGTLSIPGGAFGENNNPFTTNEIYFGAGFTESSDNPGNPGNNLPVISSAFGLDLQSSVIEACLIVELCILFGYRNLLSSIDLHLVEIVGDQVYWECVGYPQNVGTGEFFNVKNTSVLVAYGYDFNLPVVSSLQAPVPSATSSLLSGLPESSALFASSNTIPHSATALPTSTTLTPTQNGYCANGVTCLGWPLGQCCSQYSSCGSSADYCGLGCQSEFGICGLSSSLVPSTPLPTESTIYPLLFASSSVAVVDAISSPIADLVIASSTQATLPSSTPALTPSTNGLCGDGITCLGWVLLGVPAECCSAYNFCGGDSDYCGVGCQDAFGICDLYEFSPSSSMAPFMFVSSSIAVAEILPSSTQASFPSLTPGMIPTSNGQCGNGVSCEGWVSFGVDSFCCSEWNFCGSGPVYCGLGCQPSFGTCGLPDIPSSTFMTLSSPTPSAIPLPCTPFGTFYQDYGLGGSSLDICGYFGVCQNAPENWQHKASSMIFAPEVGSCTLFSATDCLGSSITYINGDGQESAFTSFNDQMMSFSCFAPILLATFYGDDNFSGGSFDAYGEFGICQNAPDNFQNVASSMIFALAGSCTLYDSNDCNGASVTYTNGDGNEAGFGFNDQMVSFSCVAPMLLATFFGNENFDSGSPTYNAYGKLGQCINAPIDFQYTAASMIFGTGVQECILFSDLDCSGNSYPYVNGDNEESSLVAFSRSMVSFTCVSPPNYVLMAMFFGDGGSKTGQAYPAYGEYDVCQDISVDSGFQYQASSMSFIAASTCTLWHEVGCSGQTFQISPSDGAFPAYQIASFSCAAPVLLATFYYDADCQGGAYDAYGPFNTCRNAPAEMQFQASSMTWGAAGSCTLYQSLDCQGSVSYTFLYDDGGEAEFAGFDNSMASFICQPPPTCMPGLTFTDYQSNPWQQLHAGPGLTEDPNSPAASGQDFITNIYGVDDLAIVKDAACSSLIDCMDWAFKTNGMYKNLDFHLLRDSSMQGHWECVGYFGIAQGDYFTVPNPNVLMAYGYDWEGGG